MRKHMLASASKILPATETAWGAAAQRLLLHLVTGWAGEKRGVLRCQGKRGRYGDLDDVLDLRLCSLEPRFCAGDLSTRACVPLRKIKAFWLVHKCINRQQNEKGKSLLCILYFTALASSPSVIT